MNLIHPSIDKPCGLEGSVEQRIKDCSSQPASKNHGFELVTRSKDFKQVHLQKKTGLPWGYRLPIKGTFAEAEEACKSDLSKVADLSGIIWRIPSADEFKEADRLSIMTVISLDNFFWTTSRRSPTSEFTLIFGGNDGSESGFFFSESTFTGNYSVVCVAPYKTQRR